MSTLDLALIGNGSVAALVDARARMNWACLPRFDGDPVFCELLRECPAPTPEQDFGYFAVDLDDFSHAEQSYLENTAVVVTRLYDQHGGCVAVTDFAPRFVHHGRMFRPMCFVRIIERVSGSPRVTVRLRPAADYGRTRRPVTWGSNHIRYLDAGFVLRLTSDASITSILEERSFFVHDSLTLVLGPDESLQDNAPDTARRFFAATTAYWRDWVRSLAIPFEWQEAVIRAAITLKLNAFDDTGAIVAAVTTSIPEAAGSGRTWDYRYCWLRDGYFVVNALNRLGVTGTMERYIDYILNIAGEAGRGAGLQPVYGIDGRADLDERIVDSLSGYRGNGPVRVGNLAYRQVQHDVYGSAILAATHVFFDRRLTQRGDLTLFRHLEPLAERAAAVFDKPDAGLWELRGSMHVHTFSAAMCWAACDRMARIAGHLRLREREVHWRALADRLHHTIVERSWSPRHNSFVAAFDGEHMDASLLLLAEIGFVAAEDPRYAGTLRAVETELRRGDFIFRYVEADDFGRPENAFIVCSFWYVNALAAVGRRDEARALFEKLLARCNRHGLLAEHIDVATGEHWGNYVQTYSMVGLINSAIRLSIRWDQAF